MWRIIIWRGVRYQLSDGADKNLTTENWLHQIVTHNLQRSIEWFLGWYIFAREAFLKVGVGQCFYGFMVDRIEKSCFVSICSRKCTHGTGYWYFKDLCYKVIIYVDKGGATVSDKADAKLGNFLTRVSWLPQIGFNKSHIIHKCFLRRIDCFLAWYLCQRCFSESRRRSVLLWFRDRLWSIP